MQNITLIKQNIHKLVLHNRKTIINEVVQTGILREAFNSNKLPKNLTEEQFLFLIGECLSEDGNFILENYKILTHPNPTPEMLNEFKINWGKVTKAIPGLLDDTWKIIKGAFKWVWKKVGDAWEWEWSGPPGSVPDVPKPPKPGKPFDPYAHPDGRPATPNDLPGEPHLWDVDPDGAYGPDRPYGGGGYGPNNPFPSELPSPPPDSHTWPPLDEMSKFNHNMKYLMESNQQIDQNLLHSMLNQVNESKYLLELAIQRNQVNRIIDRI